MLCGESAGAMPANATGLRQYYERRTRYGVVKCFRDFVIGPYRCHHYRAPF